MLELLRQRRWLGFTLFVLAMMALCVVLARWQWNRYEQRQAENAMLDAALTAPAVPVDDLIAAAPGAPGAAPLPEALEWRTVTATGIYDTSQEFAVRRRPQGGQNGFWIVTPLMTADGALLVNRGWIAAGRDALTAPDAPPPPTGAVTVTGRLRTAETFTKPDEAPPGQAWSADPQVLIQPTSLPRYNAYVELTESDPAQAEGLAALETPGHRGLNNLVYSVQWLIFAAVGAIGWWRLMRTEVTRASETTGSSDALPQDADLEAG